MEGATVTDVTVGRATFSIGTLAVCCGLVLIGYQSVWFAVLSKAFASREGLLPKDVRIDLAKRVQSGELTYTEAVRAGIYTPLGEGDVDLTALVRAGRQSAL